MPFRPIKPKIGGLEVGADGNYFAWTGGKPKHDWSGPVSTVKQHDQQDRPNPPYAAKSTEKREQNKKITALFKTGGDVEMLKDAVNAHMVINGKRSL